MICSDHNKLIISRTYLILWIENRMVTKNSLVLKCFGQHRCWWRHLFISFHVWYLRKCPNWNGEMHNKFPDNNLVLFSRLKSKSRVSVPKFSKQLDCQISTTTVFLERSTQNLAPDKISGRYDVISGCPMNHKLWAWNFWLHDTCHVHTNVSHLLSAISERRPPGT